MLWAGVFTGPAAWSLQLLINYNLEEIACSEATQDVGRIWGVGVATWILVVDVVLVVATGLAGSLALRCLRRLPADDPTPGGRARWMAAVGVMVSVLFLIVIASGVAPPLMLDVCEVSP
jgi:heme/copper-type cytochrome/quinol oxidase subunit 2